MVAKLEKKKKEGVATEAEKERWVEGVYETLIYEWVQLNRTEKEQLENGKTYREIYPPAIRQKRPDRRTVAAPVRVAPVPVRPGQAPSVVAHLRPKEQKSLQAEGKQAGVVAYLTP